MSVAHRLDGVRILCTAASLCISSCAHQIPPEGGPPDVSGPMVVYTSPAPFALNVSTHAVEIEFDEFVDKRSAEESIFISPPIDDVEFDWSGSAVTLTFPGPLKDSTTYVVTVGTDVSDLEGSRRNTMAHAYTLAFSTGPEIDRGLLSGTVIPRQRADELTGVMVFAYLLPGARADTLNPKTTSPQYMTQAGTDGSFVLPHVRLGYYLLIALRDDARDLLYDTEEDEYAIAPEIIRLTTIDTSRGGIVLHLGVEDTTGPALTKVDTLDRNHLRVEFTEPIDTSTGHSPVASVTDTTTGRSVTTFGFTVSLPDRKSANITTDFLESGATYRLDIGNIRDDAGNPGLPYSMARYFTGPEASDSLQPGVRSITPRDSAKDVSPTQEFAVAFTQDIIRGGWSPDRAHLVDQRGGVDVPTVVRWATNDLLTIAPRNELESNRWYTLSILFHGLTDWRLRELRDSVRTIRFRTADVDAYGSIQGRVFDATQRDTSGSIIVVGTSAEEKSASRMTKAAADGSFSLRFLSPGRYVLSAFRDRNANNEHDAGKPYPIVFGERHSGFSDSLRVRPRWPLDGVILRLR